MRVHKVSRSTEVLKDNEDLCADHKYGGVLTTSH